MNPDPSEEERAGHEEQVACKQLAREVRMSGESKHRLASIKNKQSDERLPRSAEDKLDFSLSHPHQVGTAPIVRDSNEQPAIRQAVAQEPAIPEEKLHPTTPSRGTGSAAKRAGRVGNHPAAMEFRLKFLAPSLWPIVRSAEKRRQGGRHS